MTYVARGKTRAGDVIEASVDAEDFDDATWHFAHGLYTTTAGQPMVVRIDYRTVRRAQKG